MIGFNKKLWKKSPFQIVLTFCLLMLIGLFFHWGAQLAFNTNTPFIAVSTSSMAISNGDASNSWIHPFRQTLQIGDLLIIQGVNPETLNTDYPNSDIIVFKNPYNSNERIIHRIVAETENNGKSYFFTKGDGNTQHKWPNPVDPAYYDQWLDNSDFVLQGAVSQELIEGKVVMRIPWVGSIALLILDIFEGLGLGDAYMPIFIVIVLIIPVLVILKLFNVSHKQLVVEHKVLTKQP